MAAWAEEEVTGDARAVAEMVDRDPPHAAPVQPWPPGVLLGGSVVDSVAVSSGQNTQDAGQATPESRMIKGLGFGYRIWPSMTVRPMDELPMSKECQFMQ